jgi:Uma2 family endonuclease
LDLKEHIMATVLDTGVETYPPTDWKDLLAEIMPPQGTWTDEQYLVLTDHTNRLIEFTDGCLEVLPAPTDRHQAILGFLFLMFFTFINPRGGKVHFAPLRLRIRPGKFREPDLLLVLDANDARRQNRFWLGADLTVEVVSSKPDDQKRDTVDKRADYAEARVPEYWIVNPETEAITVLRLEGEAYQEVGQFRRGDTATSVLLAGFSVPVTDVLDAK